jgi:hypothetical protein
MLQLRPQSIELRLTASFIYLKLPLVDVLNPCLAHICRHFLDGYAACICTTTPGLGQTPLHVHARLLQSLLSVRTTSFAWFSRRHSNRPTMCILTRCGVETSAHLQVPAVAYLRWQQLTPPSVCCNNSASWRATFTQSCSKDRYRHTVLGEGNVPAASSWKHATSKKTSAKAQTTIWRLLQRSHARIFRASS